MSVSQFIQSLKSNWPVVPPLPQSTFNINLANKRLDRMKELKSLLTKGDSSSVSTLKEANKIHNEASGLEQCAINDGQNAHSYVGTFKDLRKSIDKALLSKTSELLDDDIVKIEKIPRSVNLTTNEEELNEIKSLIKNIKNQISESPIFDESTKSEKIKRIEGAMNKMEKQAGFLAYVAENPFHKAVKQAIKDNKLEDSPLKIGIFLGQIYKSNSDQISMKDLSKYLYAEPTGEYLYGFLKQLDLKRPLADAVRFVFSSFLPTSNMAIQKKLIKQFSKAYSEANKRSLPFVFLETTGLLSVQASHYHPTEKDSHPQTYDDFYYNLQRNAPKVEGVKKDDFVGFKLMNDFNKIAEKPFKNHNIFPKYKWE